MASLRRAERITALTNHRSSLLLFLVLLSHDQEASCHVPVGQVTTVAGGGAMHDGSKIDCYDGYTMDGVQEQARFNYPWGIVYDPVENALYVADCGCPSSNKTNDRIRKVAIESGEVTTIAGSAQGYRDGVGTQALLHSTAGMAIDVEGRRIFIADSGNQRIRLLNLKTGMVSTVAGTGKREFKDGIGTEAGLANPQGLAIKPESTRLFVTDTDNHAIRMIHIPTGAVSTLAGGTKGLRDGTGLDAQFFHPTGLCLDADTSSLYVADHYNHVIRKINVLTRQVTTFCGSGGRGLKDGMRFEAKFYYPEGITYDTDHQLLYVVEFDNNAVRKITQDGQVSTLAGGSRGYENGVGREAKFFHPTGLTYDHDNKLIYITDQFNHRVRSITAVGFQDKGGYWLFGTLDTTWLILTSTGIILLFIVIRNRRFIFRRNNRKNKVWNA